MFLRKIDDVPPIGGWADRAVCKGELIDYFIIPDRPDSVSRSLNLARGRGKSGNRDQEMLKVGKLLCNECPVSLHCLADALRTGAEGVWGGTDDEDRRAMSEQQRERIIAAAELTERLTL